MRFKEQRWRRLSWGAMARAFLIMLPFLLSSCVPIKGNSNAAQPNQVVIDLFYATDRKADTKDSAVINFTNERGGLSYGICEITLNTQKNNKTVFSDWRFWPQNNSSKTYFNAELTKITSLTYTNLSQRIAQRLTRSEDKSALVFIHGYAKTFRDSAINLARYIYEINYQGVPFIYSWPSNGSAMGYTADVSTLEWSTRYFEDFLNKLAQEKGIETIHLIAHSLGNRALLNALVDQLSRRKSDRSWRWGEVVLVAPDFDRNLFERDIVPVLASNPSRVTLYISSEDFPLKISETFNQYSPLGGAQSTPSIFRGIETIDVSPSSTFFRGHSYFRKEQSVLSDMYYLLNQRKGADERPFLIPYETDAGRFWRLEME